MILRLENYFTEIFLTAQQIELFEDEKFRTSLIKFKEQLSFRQRKLAQNKKKVFHFTKKKKIKNEKMQARKIHSRIKGSRRNFDCTAKLARKSIMDDP
jgi:hypothetical protein